MPLNSIRFLLILFSFALSIFALFNFKFHYVSINSDSETVEEETHVLSFKFHYVSINSEMFQLLKNGMENFKFHYVSINSVKITNCV